MNAKKNTSTKYVQDTPEAITRRDVWQAVKNSQILIVLLLAVVGVVGTLLNYYIFKLLTPYEQRIAAGEYVNAAQDEEINSLEVYLFRIEGKLDRLIERETGK